MFAPLFNTFTAKLCRPQCHVICLSIPALVTQCRNAFMHIVKLGNLKIKSSFSGFADAADDDAKAKRMEAPLTNETNATGLVFEQVRQGQSAADQQVPQGQDTAAKIADAKQQEALRARQASEAKAKAEQEARERAAREQAAKDGQAPAPAPAQGQTSTNNDPLGLKAFDSP